MNTSNNASTPKIIGAFAIIAVTATGAYFFLFKDVSNATDASVTPTTSTVSSTDSTGTDTSTSAATSTQSDTVGPSSSSSTYKDGTYTADASYMVPHGHNSITVKLTLQNGIVTSVDTSHDYADRESSMYIASFDQSISGKVVGKAITSATNLSRVGGASLTTYGFDEAIQTVINQAKA